MTKLGKASFVAIGRHLRDDYSQRAMPPLPSELEDLVAQLVAFEFGKRSNERSVEIFCKPKPCTRRRAPHNAC